MSGGRPVHLGGRSSVERRALWVLLAVSLAFNLVGVGWGLPAYESWSNDDPTPLGPVSAAYNRFTAPTKYPLVHYATLALAYSPYLGYLVMTGGLRHPSIQFPYGFSDPLGALSTLILLGRLVSAVMGAGVVYFIYRATRSLTGDGRAALLAGCAMAFNAEFVLFAHLGNTDVPSLFWLAASFACAVRLILEWRIAPAVLLGMTSALALGTKDTTYAALGGTALVLLVLWRWESRSIRPLVSALVAFVVSYAVISNWLWGWPAYVTRLKFLAHMSQLPTLQLPATLAGHTVLLGQTVRYLAEDSGPMALAICLGIIVASRTRPRLLWLLAPVVTYYVGSIAFVRFVVPRFVLPGLIYLAPLAGIGLARVTDWPARSKWIGRAAVGVAIALSMLRTAGTDASLLFDARYEAESYLRRNVPKDAIVEVYSAPTYLPRLREMGFTVRLIAEQSSGDDALSGPALVARAPDVIVLSSKHLEGAAPEYAAYFNDLRAGNFGHRVTVFQGNRPWLKIGTGDNQGYASRVSPTIWILERRRAAGVAAPRETLASDPGPAPWDGSLTGDARAS